MILSYASGLTSRRAVIWLGWRPPSPGFGATSRVSKDVWAAVAWVEELLMNHVGVAARPGRGSVRA